MTKALRHPTSPTRMPQERVLTVQRLLVSIAHEKGAENDFQLAQAIGVNSAHLSRLNNDGYLSPKLNSVLVKAGYIEPMPEPVPVYPCTCGEVHTLKACPNQDRRRRSPRISISQTQPELAAQAIIRNTDSEFVAELLRHLTEGETT